MNTTTFLTFVGDQCGKGTEAITFYTSIFPNSKIMSIENYKEGEEGGTPDLIKYGLFTINDVQYMISESNFEHQFSFTPAISIYVECDSIDQIKMLFSRLSNEGKIYVDLDNYGADNYGFGELFGWCEDQYGVSWQLNFNSLDEKSPLYRWWDESFFYFAS